MGEGRGKLFSNGEKKFSSPEPTCWFTPPPPFLTFQKSRTWGVDKSFGKFNLSCQEAPLLGGGSMSQDQRLFKIGGVKVCSLNQIMITAFYPFQTQY